MRGYDVCPICGKVKKLRKSKNCRSCAIRANHANGVYANNKIDKNATDRYCLPCKTRHTWVSGISSAFWLLRGKNKYECRINRKNKYLNLRTDPIKLLRKRVSNLVRDSLIKHKAYKDGSCIKYLSWTILELRTHLESLWQPGMTWDNYGRNGWHIDHVVPDSWFDYRCMTDDNFKQSWSLLNLQPMWEKDNCSKGNRFSS